MYAWAIAVMVADLLPVPTNVSMGFSLSFPLELSAALLFPTPTAAAIAFLGATDARELKGEIPPLKALFVRSQIAVCVIAESAVFNHTVTRKLGADLGHVLPGPAWKLILPTLLAAIAGYALNTLFVATYHHFQHGKPIIATIRAMHEGVFGEFVLSYMALALFAVLVATSVSNLGVFAILVFAAPLAFARQMFQRTHSLQEATNELAEKQAENEYQALHDSLTGMPNRMLFQLKLADAIEASRRVDGKLAVMLIDLDHFKEINDTLGHHFGDLLLQEIGPRLSSVLRDNDLMARLGGDEFGCSPSSRRRTSRCGSPTGSWRSSRSRSAWRGSRWTSQDPSASRCSRARRTTRRLFSGGRMWRCTRPRRTAAGTSSTTTTWTGTTRRG